MSLHHMHTAPTSCTCTPSLLCVGRSASKLQGGKGEFPSVSLKREDSDMDKHYWMTRANEVGPSPSVLPHVVL